MESPAQHDRLWFGQFPALGGSGSPGTQRGHAQPPSVSRCSSGALLLSSSKGAESRTQREARGTSHEMHYILQIILTSLGNYFCICV